MAIKEKMNMNERFKYLRMMKERYEQADRQMRELLLDEMEMMTSLHRKYLIKRMNGSAPYRRRRRRERSRTYGADVDQVLSIIGDTLDWICAERLEPALVKTARHLAKFGEMEITSELLEQLQSISISTLRRRLQCLRPEGDRLPRMRRRGRATVVARAHQE